MSETEAVAKAVQHLAQLGETSLETSQKIGGFFAKVFKEPATEIAGMITDKLRFVRWQRLLLTVDEVNRNLHQRGVEDTRTVSPKLALPIFEESSLEEDQTLHSMWNGLLANAMDAQFHDEIRYAYTEIIKNLTARDAQLLHALYNTLQNAGKFDFKEAARVGISKENVCSSLGIAESDYVLSANNLMRLWVIAPFIIYVQGSGPVTISGGEKLTIDKGTDVIVMTPLGIRFIEACGEDLPIKTMNLNE